MKDDILPDWDFDIEEIAPGYSRLRGVHVSGASIGINGGVPEDELLERARQEAAAMMPEIEKGLAATRAKRAMKSAIIVPGYGYGWQKDGRTIDTPPAFKMEVRRYKESDTQGAYKFILGRASEPGHLLDGLWIFVGMRTAGPQPTYNICCYDAEPPFMDGGIIDLSSVGSSISGFGTVKAS